MPARCGPATRNSPPNPRAEVSARIPSFAGAAFAEPAILHSVARMPVTRRRFLQLLLLALASVATHRHASAKSSMSARYPLSDHFDGKRFFNPNGRKPQGLFSVLRWQLDRIGTARAEWPQWVEHDGRPQLPTQPGPRECAVTWVNHVTFLLQFAGLNVLTDPVWSERVSPFSWAGPKRVHAPGIDFDSLPPIHVVLVTHNHYDHLDVPTLQRLHAAHRPLFVTLLGNKPFLEEHGLTNVVELDWWQEHAPTLASGAPLKITATPAQHFAARGVTDRFKTLWGGFALETAAGRLYFAGDSGYFEGFAEIGRRLGPFDLAFIPIGAYLPRWFMEPVHCTPAEALTIHREVRAKKSLAMHFGCFPLADDGYAQPVEDFRAALAESDLVDGEFTLPAVGETRVLRFA